MKTHLLIATLGISLTSVALCQQQCGANEQSTSQQPSCVSPAPACLPVTSPGVPPDGKAWVWDSTSCRWKAVQPIGPVVCQPVGQEPANPPVDQAWKWDFNKCSWTLTACRNCQLAGKTLAQLIAAPPTYSANADELGHYTGAVEKAFKNDPAAVSQLVPVFEHVLADKNEWVQFYSLINLSGLVGESGNRQLLPTLADRLAAILSSGEELPRTIAMMLVTMMIPDAPEVVLPPLVAILNNKNSSQKLLSGAVAALMSVRPLDESTQRQVITVINDPTRPIEQRCRLLYDGANEIAGPLYIANVVSIANTSTDKQFRDSAFSVAGRIGLKALTPLNTRLQQVANDTSETAESRTIARQALEAESRLQK